MEKRKRTDRLTGSRHAPLRVEDDGCAHRSGGGSKVARVTGDDILRKWMGSTKACGKVVGCGDVKGLNVARIVRGGHKPSEIQSESNIKNQRS